MVESTNAVTYLIVDGENIDATLGVEVLDRRPSSEERPRWDRLRRFAEEQWEQPVKALFFLNGSSGELPTAFVRALLSMEYRPIPLAGVNQKVVDIGIQRTLEALEQWPGNVLLASHDGDFLPQIASLLGTDRRVGVVGFPEHLNAGFADLTEAGLEIFDLEDDALCFTHPLPRVRIIPIDKFDPLHFL
ncbi:NYN domain-containing protein [Planosporangium flavigriseum]|uniref:Nuclease n=1 Tax=Planosporangium flavigriseum TaxID=373681 RepID=A0A8J3LPU4_9ACTN|nr:NYN domain-containing protein [Planosporangium flavigriseum]NJC63932.1 NYN domain-containing protein [Planosporangium flavigriseum]GIG74645.1 nuclease [Planosporangium flavigriseum]